MDLIPPCGYTPGGKNAFTYSGAYQNHLRDCATCKLMIKLKAAEDMIEGLSQSNTKKDAIIDRQAKQIERQNRICARYKNRAAERRRTMVQRKSRKSNGHSSIACTSNIDTDCNGPIVAHISKDELVIGNSYAFGITVA